ncbi:MAG TPA: hypothetical protein VKE69_04315 [Planctomycetota bacterium]|nr:hypothetical protein [Planctomycetota bacterium]
MNAPAGPPSRSSVAERLYVCERCGTEMIEHHCKIRCPNCGYVRDCSDPRRPIAPRGSFEP